MQTIVIQVKIAKMGGAGKFLYLNKEEQIQGFVEMGQLHRRG